MTPEEIQQIEEFAASGQPVSSDIAQGVLRLFDRFDRHRSTGSFVPLAPNERLALACRASAWPEERIAGILNVADPAVRPLLLGTLRKLAHNLHHLGPGDGDNRSGDRAPGPKPRGGLPSLTAAKPLPREDPNLALQRGGRLVRAVPVDWADEGSGTP